MGQFQKGIRPDMDKNVIRRGEIVSDSGKLYSVIGVLGTVMYIQETDAGNKKVDYQLKEIEPLFRKIEYVKKAYPDEIMYTVKDENGRLNNSEIQNELSPITAYHLGWVNYIEEIDVFPQLKR